MNLDEVLQQIDEAARDMKLNDQYSIVPGDGSIKDIEPGVITFHCNNCTDEAPLLQLGPKDEIRVRGKLVENDRIVVRALQHFVIHGLIPPTAGD